MAIEELAHETVEQAGTDIDGNVHAVAEVVADDLVEDVSIDGMCGVY